MKPRHVYLVLNTRDQMMQIVACFYSKDAAYKYTGGNSSTTVQKISVL